MEWGGKEFDTQAESTQNQGRLEEPTECMSAFSNLQTVFSLTLSASWF